MRDRAHILDTSTSSHPFRLYHLKLIASYATNIYDNDLLSIKHYSIKYYYPSKYYSIKYYCLPPEWIPDVNRRFVCNNGGR